MFNSQFFKKLPQLAGVAALASAMPIPSGSSKRFRAPRLKGQLSHKQNAKRRHKRRISSRSRAINRGR